MSISVLSRGHILTRLHAVLAVLITRALSREVSARKMLTLMRTIRRLTKAIIMAEVAIYQSKVKADMLADPAWRARVINDLGGYPALSQWRKNFRIASRRAGQCRNLVQLQTSPPWPRSPKTARAPKPSPQFRLPPMPRQFFGRRLAEERSRIYTPAPIISPFDAPIIIAPQEFYAPRITPPRMQADRAHDDRDSQTRPPPPKPDPP